MVTLNRRIKILIRLLAKRTTLISIFFKLNFFKFGETCYPYLSSPGTQSPFLPGTWVGSNPAHGYRWCTQSLSLLGTGGVPGHPLYLVPHTLYQVFFSTWYQVLLFSSSQAPPGNYLRSCRTLILTYRLICLKLIDTSSVVGYTDLAYL